MATKCAPLIAPPSDLCLACCSQLATCSACLWTGCDLGDEGIRPLFAAIARNKKLHVLNCLGNNVSAACIRDVALPAVQANTYLIGLVLDCSAPCPELDQALQLVRAHASAACGAHALASL